MAKKNPKQPELPISPSPQTPIPRGEEKDLLAHLRRPLTKEDLDKVRHIEGFPIGEDEDIIALSDPPYYTACPSPFLEDFVKAYGTPYNEATDTYHREPFAADVSEGKNDPIYNAHSYHTKVPHKAIMRYILHYTEPGDVVFDGFCGTGMTGVAAQMCGKPDPDFKAKIESEMPGVKWGARQAILSDLSPAATFITYNYNMSVDIAEFEKEIDRILAEVNTEYGWMYKTLHTDGKTTGEIISVVWSDVFVCPECSSEIVFWDVAVDIEAGAIKDKFKCPNCGASLRKTILERAWQIKTVESLGEPTKYGKQVPVRVNYSVEKKRYTKKPDTHDLEIIAKIDGADCPYSYPTTRIDIDIDLWYERDYRSLGIYSIDGFYTKRNLWLLSALWHKSTSIQSERIRHFLQFALTGMQVNLSRMNRWRPNVSFPYNPLSGTLYVGSLPLESNVLTGISNKAKRLSKIYMGFHLPGIFALSTQSLGDTSNQPSEAVDYIFTDPPFGSNIIYSDLSIIWESWLRLATATSHEAVVHRRKKQKAKTLDDYLSLMASCFHEYHRILKPGRWITVEFHNSQNKIWNAIQESILRSGFVIADVRTLDKQASSFKQTTAEGAVKQDLVISAYKPHTSFEQRFLQEAGSEQGAWDFIRQHLRQLPVFVAKDDAVEIVAERQNYLLFDRMVAFHIQRGASVPLSASEFYAGLAQRFPERDGMYFLTEQIAEYDTKRAFVAQVEQLNLFVADEKTARHWLRTELGQEPQTYQDLQPKFLQELHQARHEQLPELSQLLAESFLKDESDRWYVPDPAKAEDLEKLRERGLLKEFAAYRESKGKLKTFRTEAIRAGFKDAWARRDYAAILEVGRRLPEDVLGEDPALLMYYDNAGMRVK